MAISPTRTRSSSPTTRPKTARIPGAATAARDALYLCAGLPAGVVAFTVLVTGLSLAAGLAITLLGIPVMLATLYAARAMADVERRRAGWVLGAAVPRSARPWRGGIWQRTKAAFTDPGAWRDIVWGLILFPLGTFGFVVATTLWSAALAMLTSPAWYWALPDDDDQAGAALDFLTSHDVGPSIARVAAGLVLVGIAVLCCRALAEATARAARALLQD